MSIAYFIQYSFQYLGPAAKIGIGYAVGAALIGAGVWLNRRAALAWYGRGLIGGGWAIVYFATYAMHHIPEVRIVPSALADLVLLLAVTAGAVRHALAFKSQTITALAFLLGFITTSISTVTYFTLASTALLVVALAVVAVRMKWHALCLFGVMASYACQTLWLNTHIYYSPIIARPFNDVATAEFWLITGFLTLYWVVYTIALRRFTEGTREERQALVLATLVNGVGFMTQLLRAMDPVFPQHQWVVLTAIGALYLLLGMDSSARGQSSVSTVCQLLGLSFVTLAIPERLEGRWARLFWTIEIIPLLVIGLRHNRGAYRAFAFALGVLTWCQLMMQADSLNWTGSVGIFGWDVPWRAFIRSIAVAAFGISAWLYRYRSLSANLRLVERNGYAFYLGATVTTAMVLIAQEAAWNWAIVWWAGTATTLVAVGRMARDRVLRIYGILWHAGVGCWLYVRLWDSMGVTTVPIIVTIALLYAAMLMYRRLPSGESFKFESQIGSLYGVAASSATTALLMREVPGHWLSAALGVQGCSLILTGFLLKDRVLRITGLAVFGLMVGRVLLIDLAGVETIYRILSFLAVGVLLLAASLAYGRFTTSSSRRADTP